MTTLATLNYGFLALRSFLFLYAPVIPIGQLNDEFGLVSAHPIQHDCGNVVVEPVTFGHSPEDWELQLEHGNVGEVLGAVAVNNNNISLWKKYIMYYFLLKDRWYDLYMISFFQFTYLCSTNLVLQSSNIPPMSFLQVFRVEHSGNLYGHRNWSLASFTTGNFHFVTLEFTSTSNFGDKGLKTASFSGKKDLAFFSEKGIIYLARSLIVFPINWYWLINFRARLFGS